MHCPHDNIAMRTIQLDTLTLDVCPVCAGIWLDKSELPHATHRLNATFLTPVTLPTFVEEATTTQPKNPVEARVLPSIYCPNGDGEMRRRHYLGNSGIWIDSCEICGGVWLDGGELMAIAKTIAPNPTEDALVAAMAHYRAQDIRDEGDMRTLLELLKISFITPVGIPLILLACIGMVIRNMVLNPEHGVRY